VSVNKGGKRTDSNTHSLTHSLTFLCSFSLSWVIVPCTGALILFLLYSVSERLTYFDYLSPVVLLDLLFGKIIFFLVETRYVTVYHYHNHNHNHIIIILIFIIITVVIIVEVFLLFVSSFHLHLLLSHHITLHHLISSHGYSFSAQLL